MILKYKNKILNTEDYYNHKLFINVNIEYNADNIPMLSNYKLYISMKKRGSCSAPLEVQIEDNLELVKKLVKDISENLKKGTEFYNIETKIKECITK